MHIRHQAVLLAEHWDGYPRRLLAIGHLFEAEDKSQAWPDLHAAIREARKAYQADSTMPNWEPLGAATDSVRLAKP
jgi:hypothetical protein